MRLRDKVALLSGVGLGMGRATALLFAREGASVVLSARRQEPLEETASLIGPSHGGTTVVPGDVSVKSEAERVVTRVVDEYGRLDILYCGAGGFFEPGRDFGDVDQAYWQGVLDNTANSLYNLAQAVSPVMRGQGGGSIGLGSGQLQCSASGQSGLRRGEGRRHRPRAKPGDQALPGQRPGQHHRARTVQRPNSPREGRHPAPVPGPDRPPRGHRLRRAIPGVRRGGVGDRTGAHRGRRGRRRHSPALGV